MAIDVSQVAAELKAYAKSAKKEVSGFFYDVPSLDPYLRPITSVDGEYPAVHSIITNVIQRFRPQWDAKGDSKFVPKKLNSTPIKVNYPVVPANVMGTWLSFLYAENKKAADMPISKYVMEQDLAPKIMEDMAWLMINGQDNASPYGQFEYAFPGIVAAIQAAVADADNPAYLIPMTTITEGNAIEQLQNFELNIPSKAKRLVKNIFVSERVSELYAIDVKNTYGGNTGYKDSDQMTSPLGKRNVVGLPYLPNNIVFATVPNNMLKLIDIFAQPQITDVQVQDYTVKVFGEMKIGVDFAVNQALFVGNFANSDSGFAANSDPAAMKKLYYVE